MAGDSETMEICLESPICYRVAVEYKPQTVKLTIIDLFDPDSKDEDDVWKSLAPPYNDDAEKTAVQSLKSKAADGEFDVPLCAVGCVCVLAKKWAEWSDWSTVEISGGFSLPAPNPPPPRLRYRANGTVQVRSRVKPGLCYRTVLA